VWVYENASAVPLASFRAPEAVRIAATDESQLDEIRRAGFDPWKELVLPQPVADYQGAPGNAERTSVDSVRLSGSFLEISASNKENAILYINETFYDGTGVTIDGASGKLMRANYAFTAVALKPGKHRLRITYATPAYRAGVILSSASWILVLMVFAIRRKP
jgi:hypothetical protein